MLTSITDLMNLLSAVVAFNNKMNNSRSSSKSSIKNGSMQKKENGGMGKKKKLQVRRHNVSLYRVADIKLRLEVSLFKMKIHPS